MVEAIHGNTSNVTLGSASIRRTQLKNLFSIARITFGRIIGCMLIAWIVYNPWFSLVGWLGPQMAGSGEIEHAWPFKLLLTLVAAGIVIGLAVTVRKALGLWWGGLIGVVATVLAYTPAYIGWITLTPLHVFYALWFFVVPVEFGCALSSGYLIRYLKGMTSVQGHVSADITSVPEHHEVPSEAHEPTT